MKVLATGANGYLGTGVVKQLCDNGVDVDDDAFDGDCHADDVG